MTSVDMFKALMVLGVVGEVDRRLVVHGERRWFVGRKSKVIEQRAQYPVGRCHEFIGRAAHRSAQHADRIRHVRSSLRKTVQQSTDERLVRRQELVVDIATGFGV
eukprot:6183001-Pleurochrysis_carterae.AAC.2